MTYVPAVPKASIPAATALAAADIVVVNQSGVDRRTTLAGLKAFLLGTPNTTTPTATPPPPVGGTAPSSTSSVVVTDTSGHVATVPLTVVQNFTAAQLGLDIEIYFFLTNGSYYLGSSNDNKIASAVIHDGSNVSATTFSNVTYVAGAAVAGESAEGDRVTTVGPVLTTSSGVKYGITSGAQVSINGVTATGTSNVNLLLYHGHQAYQRNAGGEYYTSGTTTDLDQYTGNTDPTASGGGATGGSISTPTPSPTTPSPTTPVTSATGTGLYTYPAGRSGPYGGIGDTGSGAGPQAYLYGRSLGDLYGTFTYPNPGSTNQDGDTTYRFDQTMPFLIDAMGGVKPKTMNAFNNAGYGDVSKVGSGSYAYGWYNERGVLNLSGPDGVMKPIIGFKLNGSAQGWANPGTYDDIANGVYDSQFINEMNTWIGLGYKSLIYRPAYEMNGTFMPDYAGHNVTDNHRFAAAFRHVALIMKARAANAGVHIEFTFNPSFMNGGDTDIMEAYPGDDVIDIIDCDTYNTNWQQTLQNYGANGLPDGTYSANQSEWTSKVNNRRKFWNYPGIKDNYPAQGNVYDYSPGSWSALRAIEIAKAKGKKVAFSECGSGELDPGDGNYDHYFPNDSEWAKWFWQILQSAISQGVVISHFNLWNVWADDGHWWYAVPGRDPQPVTRKAMRMYFGDGYYEGGPTPQL